MAVHLVMSNRQAGFLQQFLRQALGLKYAYTCGVGTATAVRDKLKGLEGVGKESGKLICVVPPSPSTSENKQPTPATEPQGFESIRTV